MVFSFTKPLTNDEKHFKKFELKEPLGGIKVATSKN